MKTKTNLVFYSDLLKKFFEATKEQRQLAIIVLIYGLLISFVMSVFFGFNFDLMHTLAFGIFWYFLSEEFPIVFGKFKGGSQ